jgi:hypothetical protein
VSGDLARKCAGCGTAAVAYKLDGRFFCEACGRSDAIVNGANESARRAAAPSAAGWTGTLRIGSRDLDPERSLSARGRRPAKAWRSRLALALGLGAVGAVVIVGVGALGYFAAPRQADPARHIVLPGWEDVIPGQRVPADARQTCKPSGLKGDNPPLLCRGCRSANLPTPCIEVLTMSSAPDTVNMVSVVLPDVEDEAQAVISALRSAWGRSTRSEPKTINEIAFECWRGKYEGALLSTNFTDLQGRRLLAVDHAGLDAPEPRRVVSITSVDLTGGVDLCSE